MDTGPSTDALFPGGGSWFPIDTGLRRALAGCPDLPRMTDALERARAEAERLQDVAWFDDTSFVRPGTKLRLGLSFDRDSARHFVDAPRPCWHLSISEGFPAAAVSQVELLGWVMAGWPDVDEVATYALSTATARHAEIPV